MTQPSIRPSCPECEPKVDRRSFLKTAGAVSLGPLVAPAVWAAPTPSSAAETVVGRFHQSLSAEQKKTICLPFEHEARQRISANWHVTKPLIGDDFFTKDQRALIGEIVRKVSSEEGAERLTKQMDEDAGGIDNFSVAVFGEPGTGKFQFELTGRHLTLRADGNSVDKAAFGGPIIYGHGEESPRDNIYYFQTRKVNEVFKALDGKQMEKALLQKPPAEAAVKVQGEKGKFAGLAISELSKDQKQLVEGTLKMLLSPYRAEDVDEAMSMLKSTGGLDKLHLAFYQQEDLEGDRIWDIWRVEGPSFVWHFRGAPHVHAYINIGLVG